MNVTDRLQQGQNTGYTPSTRPGISVRPLTPPKAVPLNVLPVTEIGYVESEPMLI